MGFTFLSHTHTWKFFEVLQNSVRSVRTVALAVLDNFDSVLRECVCLFGHVLDIFVSVKVENVLADFGCQAQVAPVDDHSLAHVVKRVFLIWKKETCKQGLDGHKRTIIENRRIEMNNATLSTSIRRMILLDTS